MLKKAYIEITNVCNLSCSFCPGTKRAPRFMTVEEFSVIAEKLRGHTKFLYFHLMGEPLLHPQLKEMLEAADSLGFKVIITTNGTLLKNVGQVLLSSPALHRVNISLQSFEANTTLEDIRAYISACASFAEKAAEKGIICSLRLWNNNGENLLNGRIIELMSEFFPQPWNDTRRGLCLGDLVFLEYGDKFDWPDMSAVEGCEARFCYGLRDQMGVLCDGTVVPCCLDHEGDIPLGNLFSDTLNSILASPKAKAVYNGFSARRAVEPLCLRCAYSRRFSR